MNLNSDFKVDGSHENFIILELHGKILEWAKIGEFGI